MNLGQLIGELQVRASGEDLLERAMVTKPRAVARPGEPAAKVLALIEEQGSVSSRDVQKALGITPTYSSVLLLTMLRQGLLSRRGECRAYRYEAP